MCVINQPTYRESNKPICYFFFFFVVRPTKPPPPPRSLPPITKLPLKTVPSAEIIDYPDAPKTCDSSTSDETYEPINFSAPECDHSSPETTGPTSIQYYGSETESEIYPAIQFGDDVSTYFYRIPSQNNVLIENLFLVRSRRQHQKHSAGT